MKLTFYTVNAISTQYGIRYVNEIADDWITDRKIYEYCRDNNIGYFLVRGSEDDSTHVRFATETERFEFTLKWF